MLTMLLNPKRKASTQRNKLLMQGHMQLKLWRSTTGQQSVSLWMLLFAFKSVTTVIWILWFFFLFLLSLPKIHSIQTMNWWSWGSLHVCFCRHAHFSIWTSLRRRLMLNLAKKKKKKTDVAGAPEMFFAELTDNGGVLSFNLCKCMGPTGSISGLYLTCRRKWSCDCIYLYCY